MRAWFQESPRFFTAALTLGLVAFGLFWFLGMPLARAPSASLSLQPVLNDRGLQEAAGGRRNTNEVKVQPNPMPRLDAAEAPDSEKAVPEHDDADPSDAFVKRLNLDLDSGNTAEILRESASGLEKARAILSAPRDESETEAPPEASTSKQTAHVTQKTTGLTKGAGRMQAESGGANRFGSMVTNGTGKQSARFFGLGAEDARSVVYVIDCSGSMGRPPQKFLLAQKELMRSIQALQANQTFFVIFFNDGMIPMRGAEMLSATDGNKDEVCEWIATAFSGGGTNPLPAMHRALQLQPEAIYLLSDGLFKGEYVREIQHRNRGQQRATIYTIGFGDRSGEEQLQRLARENGGSYRFVQP